MKRVLIFAATLILLATLLCGQNEDQRYVRETDLLVLKNLDHWQDLKFGLLMHWGTYSQWGIVESWSICAEDESWCRRSLPDYVAYKKEYEKLKTTFNPTGFDPARWARAARDAGMKYVVFTTKHHDGFSMFDSKYTDYKVTSPDCPFHTSPRESCIISGGGWSFTPNARYMNPGQAVRLLVDIVAKGGNLLLNVAPGPDGTWQQGAYDLLKEMGAWIKVNGEAIYETRPMAPYKDGKVCMTRRNNGNVFFLYLADAQESAMPKEIRVSSHRPAEGAQVTLLGSNASLPWKAEGDGFVVSIPDSLRANAPCRYAWTIRVSSVK